MKQNNKKQTISQIATVIACSLASFGGLASGANILLNGSFESPSALGNQDGNNVGAPPDDWTFTPVGGSVSNTVRINVPTPTYGDGPTTGMDGLNYMDIGGNGYFSQAVTLTVASPVTFGGYFSRRAGVALDNSNNNGSTSIWDAANTTLLFSSPTVFAPAAGSINNWVSSFSTVPSLPAGSYTFRIEMQDYANVDNVSLDAVPEVASSVLGILGLLTFAFRRNRL